MNSTSELQVLVTDYLLDNMPKSAQLDKVIARQDGDGTVELIIGVEVTECTNDEFGVVEDLVRSWNEFPGAKGLVSRIKEVE